MADGSEAGAGRKRPSPRRRRARAPTTPDPIEIAMEAADNPTLSEPVRTLLGNQNRLVLWQIVSERAGIADKRASFVLKALTGLAGPPWPRPWG